ncbi:MAG TPA: cyclic nucleotide-binding domain-containing protein [Chloroflexota bacterium]|nr:cyclic nucleotide-binding domain-containing protein [Chloroflexota bacterium]
MELRENNLKAQVIDLALAEVPFLRSLGWRQRARLARQATTRRYPAGAVIVREGDTGMTVYVVLSGAVDMAGRRAERGACFGAADVIHDRPRGETVVAVEPTECVLLAKWDFTALLVSEPWVALSLLAYATRDTA